MKKFALALSSLAITSSIFAAFPGTTDPTVIDVPDYLGGFFIGGTALYQQSATEGGATDFANINPGAIGNVSTVQHVGSSYDWGWGANIGFIIPHTGNDIELKYWQLDSDSTNSLQTGLTEIFPIQFFDFVEYDQAHAKVDNDIWQLNLNAGQWINIGCRARLHPQVGVQYTNLDRKTTLLFISAEELLPATSLYQLKSDFNGVGPEVGIDGSYYLDAGVGLVGHFSSALLVGDVHPSLATREFFPTGSSTLFTYTFTVPSRNRVVPNVDGKLGADYTFLFNNDGDTSLTLEAGYEVNNYFNVIDTVTGDASVVSDIRFRNARTSDLAVYGPYASLVVHI